MANVYVEARPKGRPRGALSTIMSSKTMRTTCSPPSQTQREAIEWAKSHGHVPHVARVRHLNDKKKPDHWRAA